MSLARRQFVGDHHHPSIFLDLQNRHQGRAQKLLWNGFAFGQQSQRVIEALRARMESTGDNLALIVPPQEPHFAKQQRRHEWQPPIRPSRNFQLAPPALSCNIWIE
jgi:hypothetical protein